MKINGQIFHLSKQLSEHQLLPTASACPFCGATERSTEYVLQKQPLVELLQCSKCHAATASRMPTAEALDNYYTNYYDSPADDKPAERVTFDNSPRFGKHLTSVFSSRLHKADLSILDFGGGDGSIACQAALQMLKHGCRQVSIVVSDYNDTLITPPDSRISIRLARDIDQLSDSFDIVIASAIIEHLPEPRAVLQRLFDLLAEGGIFYARTPFVLPLMKMFKHFRISWDFTYPAHLHDLGQDFWENYFRSSSIDGQYELLESRPSIVETTLQEHWFRTVSAHLFKAPWYLFGRSYGLVGGWEVFARKVANTK